MANYRSLKHKELAEQLVAWWGTQTNFPTKKALAELIRVHPDTLGDYFAGRNLPEPHIAARLCELTNLDCLKPEAGASPLTPKAVTDSLAPRLASAPDVATSPQKPAAPVLEVATDPPETPSRQPSELQKKGEFEARPAAIISLERATCPFCAHDIVRFGHCRYCGQHFVWANIPIKQDEPL